MVSKKKTTLSKKPVLKKVETKKIVAKKTTPVKPPVAKKPIDKKPVLKKVETKKIVAKKITPVKQTVAKKLIDKNKKHVLKKVETKKIVAKKTTPVKTPVAKKLIDKNKKPVLKKVEIKKIVAEKITSVKAPVIKKDTMLPKEKKSDKKVKTIDVESSIELQKNLEPEIITEESPKRKRGRPAKPKEEGSEIPGEYIDGIDSELLAPSMKRRRGRPPKNAVAPELLVEGSSNLFSKFKKPLNLIKKVSRPQKQISNKLPGTGIADWIITNKISDETNLNHRINKIATESVLGITKENNEKSISIADLSFKPSWKLPNWVTNGEALVLKGKDLIKEENLNINSENTPNGVHTPEEVQGIINKIREAFKKKPPLVKKIASLLSESE